MRAIVLFSGGLDSVLATKILQRQNIEVIGLNFVTPFHDALADSQKRAEEVGIELVVHRTGDDYLQMLRSPKWGYGKAVNPCIDCRVTMCCEAKKLCEVRDADFVATGEIVGQRPNSQMMHQLKLIERESGLEGRLLRPLSAGVLTPTILEQEGKIDRNKLHSYTGRGRGNLIVLARENYGVKKIPQPSTGCQLCETSYAPRVRDLFRYEKRPTNWDADLLNCGRQIRISPKIKAVLGRNADQCDRLHVLFMRHDAKPCLLFVPESFTGPSLVLVGASRETMTDMEWNDALLLGGSLVVQFTNPAKFANVEPQLRVRFGESETVITATTDADSNRFSVIE